LTLDGNTGFGRF